MTDITSTSTFTQIAPNAGVKDYLIVTPSTAAPSDTISVSGKIATIYGVHIIGADGAAVASGTWSTTTITIPGTASTAVKYIRVWGLD